MTVWLMGVLVVGVVGAVLGPLGGVVSRDLTKDGVDRYTVVSTSTTLRVSAPADNAGSNLRRVYWPAGSALRRDGVVCATWSWWSTESVQPGLAVRVSSDRAITVTRNVWAGAYWVLNVHTWLGAEFTQVAQIDLARLVLRPEGGYRPLPWRLCVRADGSVLSVKIWFPPEDEPGWDSDRGWLVQLPEGWAYPGVMGWYAGHIPAGGQLFMSGLGVRR